MSGFVKSHLKIPMKDRIFKISKIIRWACPVSLVLAPIAGMSVDVFTDNFDDGNDDEWTHFGLESIGLPPPSYEFPDDVWGGKAYRIATPAPPVPDAGPGRAFTYLEQHVLSDFLIEADVLDWDNDIDQAFGFLLRAENIGLGQTTGYVVNYDPQQESGGRGQFQINRVVGEASDETIAAGDITLQPGEDYRMVAAGIGADLYAAIYSLKNLTDPIVVISSSDDAFSSGVFGFFNFSRVDAEDYTNSELGRADSTFDNFRLSDDPFEAIEPFLGFFVYAGLPSIPGQPDIFFKSPHNLDSYIDAESGLFISVLATEGNPLNTGSAKLILNGRDVSSGLDVTEDQGAYNFEFDGLQPNTVYHAYAEVSAENGQTSSVEWTFDTFEESFLGSDEVVVIEAEDYNYEGGQYQNDPPVSGFTFDGVQVRGFGEGYLDLIGVPGVDYFDYSDQTGGGVAPEYRLDDNVGTQIGSVEIEPGIFINDWIRGKYLVEGLEEYQVRRTEGGEWLNYTRDFPEGEYQVYLRAASRAQQSVLLDRVMGSAALENQATESIGQFNLPNDGLKNWYRYTPLVDENGNPITVSLSGTETVRLTMGGEREDRTQYTTVLNFLAFIPAEAGPAYELYAAESLGGDFAPDTTAVLDSEAGTFTVSLDGAEKYFRVMGSAATRIESIRVEEGMLILEFVNE